MPVDFGGLVIRRGCYSNRTYAVHQSRYRDCGAGSATGVVGEERLCANLRGPDDDIPPLEAIANMRINPRSEVVLHIEGVRLRVLPQKIGDALIIDIRARAAGVLRAGSRVEARTGTSGGAEEIWRCQQGASKETGREEIPTAGNPEIVKAKRVHQPEAIAQVNR